MGGQRPEAKELASLCPFVKMLAFYGYPSFQLFSHLGNWITIGLFIYYVSQIKKWNQADFILR